MSGTRRSRSQSGTTKTPTAAQKKKWAGLTKKDMNEIASYVGIAGGIGALTRVASGKKPNLAQGRIIKRKPRVNRSSNKRR